MTEEYFSIKLDEVDRKVNTLCQDIAIIKVRLLGNGATGLIGTVEDIEDKINGIEDKITDLENYKAYQKGLFSLGALVAIISGSIYIISNLSLIAKIIGI